MLPTWLMVMGRFLNEDPEVLRGTALNEHWKSNSNYAKFYSRTAHVGNSISADLICGSLFHLKISQVLWDFLILMSCSPPHHPYACDYCCFGPRVVLRSSTNVLALRRWNTDGLVGLNRYPKRQLNHRNAGFRLWRQTTRSVEQLFAEFLISFILCTMLTVRLIGFASNLVRPFQLTRAMNP